MHSCQAHSAASAGTHYHTPHEACPLGRLKTHFAIWNVYLMECVHSTSVLGGRTDTRARGKDRHAC